MRLNQHPITDIRSVQRFRDILSYELHFSAGMTALIYAIYLVGGVFIAIPLFTLAAVLFTPYIFYILIREKRYGWIGMFFIMIATPIFAAFLIFRTTIAFETFLLFALLAFYLYCYLIKHAVDEWVRQYNWAEQLMRQKEEKIKRIEDERPWY